MVYAYDKPTFEITHLLYIGESTDIYERLSVKYHQKDWLEKLKMDEEACYTYAVVTEEDRAGTHDAMIYHEQPVYNTMNTESFIHDDTEIIIKSKSVMEPEEKSYTVYRTK